LQDLHFDKGTNLSNGESSVSDVHVYYFLVWDRMAGEYMLFARPATLEAIAGKGEPVLESKVVVDHTELDAEGFLSANVGDDSYSFGIPSRDRFIDLAPSRDSDQLIPRRTHS
jgi:hypothetical protein